MTQTVFGIGRSGPDASAERERSMRRRAVQQASSAVFEESSFVERLSFSVKAA
jgi:hypothetical protein